MLAVSPPIVTEWSMTRGAVSVTAVAVGNAGSVQYSTWLDAGSFVVQVIVALVTVVDAATALIVGGVVSGALYSAADAR